MSWIAYFRRPQWHGSYGRKEATVMICKSTIHNFTQHRYLSVQKLCIGNGEG
jgi:hypothetical protein